MQDLRAVSAVLGVLTILYLLQGGGFKADPAAEFARYDAAGSNEPSEISGAPFGETTYLTRDSFGKDGVFNKGIVKKSGEQGVSKGGPQLALFMPDSEKLLASSKLLTGIQRPAPDQRQSAGKESQ